jgi:hypothetical protein
MKRSSPFLPIAAALSPGGSRSPPSVPTMCAIPAVGRVYRPHEPKEPPYRPWPRGIGSPAPVLGDFPHRPRFGERARSRRENESGEAPWRSHGAVPP